MLPANFSASMGLFSFDAGTPLTSGAWEAARAGADCAIAATQQVAEGARAAFVLTRPPGHHAGADFFGGYCFLNNAVLDIDYHHGNGTEAIFYDLSDVLLRGDDYFRVGEDLARAGLSSVFVFKGGYAVAELGVNAVYVLDGFEQADT